MSLRRTLIPMLSVSLLLGLQSAEGSLKPEEYEKALQIAQRKVQREAVLAQPGAISATPASRIMGRFYEVGDQWEIALWRSPPTQMRRTSDPRHLVMPLERGPLFFRYEVIDVKTGPEARVVLRVSQRQESSETLMHPYDTQVEHLLIELSPQLIQTKKAYKLKGQTQSVNVSPEGIRSGMTPLEMLPLDFPNVLTAEQSAPRVLPDLPEQIAKTAHEFGYAPDLSKSLWFEQDDFFGRPVQALWQHGDPWPSYLKTVHGIALLIRKGTP